jgi:hypothetical protein
MTPQDKRDYYADDARCGHCGCPDSSCDCERCPGCGEWPSECVCDLYDEGGVLWGK